MIEIPLIIKIIGALLGFGFIAFVIFMLFRTSWAKFSLFFDFTEFLTYRPYGLKKITKRWEKTKVRLQTGREAEYKLAVIEADGILDETLKRMGFPGSNAGERMQQLSAVILPNLNDVLDAHRIRNNIVHDPDFRLSAQETRRILEIYEQAFQNLDLI